MDGPQPILPVVAALVWQAGDLLLVQQQGPDDDAPTWALPGGVGHPGELLGETLAREVSEETGLQVLAAGRLAYLAQRQTGAAATLAFVFAVERWQGELRPADPDRLIHTAAFVPLPEALARLEALPWRMIREPLLAYLRGQVAAGAVWLYRALPDGSDRLEACLGDEK